MCKYIFLWDRPESLSKLKGGQDAHPTHNKLSLQKWDAPSRKLIYSASRLSEIRDLTSNPFPSREGGKLLSRVGERGQSDCLLLH